MRDKARLFCMHAVVREVHNAMSHALRCHDLHALIQQRHSYYQIPNFHTVNVARNTHGILEHPAELVTRLFTHYISGVSGASF